jgi:hypothetical protein
VSATAAPVATYTFNGNFNALEGGVPSLTSVDPLGTGAFQTETVFGVSRNTWHFDGSTTPANQGGLSLDTTGLIPANNYSVEMVFEFLGGTNAWRRILDVQNRQSDNGFYVDPSNHLDVFPVGGSGNFTTGSFFDVFLTVDASNNVTAYFSGVSQFTDVTTVMDVNNPGNLMNFFLDNTVGGGQGEWAPGNISLLKVYNTALTAAQVAAETADPFASVVPEPTSWTLMMAGGALLTIGKLRRRR